MSLYIVLEAKYVRNWKNEAREWTHYPMRIKKIVEFGVFRPWSLGYEIRRDPSILSLSTNRKELSVLSACRPIEVRCRLSQGSAVDQKERAEYSRNFRQKNRWVEGGDGGYARPSLPIRIKY